MGIFDFFKKKVEKKEIKTENIHYNNLKKVLKEKEETITTMQKEMMVSFYDKKKLFISDLNEKILILEKIDLEKVKEHPKIKHLVLLNRDLYIKDIQRLLSNIELDKNIKFDDFKDKIEKNFIEFKKNSELKYRKATHLIGKEIAIVNETINNFFKDYHQNIGNDKHLIYDSKLINSIKTDMDKIHDYEEEIKEIKQKSESINYELHDQIKHKKNLEHELESLKKSEDYLLNLENIKKEKEINFELEKELDSLKQLIDFKTLSKTFHGIKKYEPIVHEFRNDFNEHFKLDDGLKLLELIHEAKMDNEVFISKFEIVKKITQKIKIIKSDIIEDKTKPFELEIKSIQSKIDQSNEDKKKEDIRLEKIKHEKSQIFIKLKKDLKLINIELLK